MVVQLGPFTQQILCIPYTRTNSVQSSNDLTSLTVNDVVKPDGGYSLTVHELVYSNNFSHKKLCLSGRP